MNEQQEVMKHIERIRLWIRELSEIYRGSNDARLKDLYTIADAAQNLHRLWGRISRMESEEEKISFSHDVRMHLNTIIGFSHPDTLHLYDEVVSQREHLYYQDIHTLGKQILEKINTT
ncbi:MAG: hypothetical protein CUN56_00940 [Phototrophicales bacterium]|nr:MAG: hypothetical protein CUN56_00940 [Phototrophicales bacterium]RMG74780.1 MAG: hypothetical protein D6711_08035 [Chloroflexota bacterium]